MKWKNHVTIVEGTSLNYDLKIIYHIYNWFQNCSSDALIYNENHVNVRYQPFKVIRPTQIEVIMELIVHGS